MQSHPASLLSYAEALERVYEKNMVSLGSILSVRQRSEDAEKCRRNDSWVIENWKMERNNFFVQCIKERYPYNSWPCFLRSLVQDSCMTKRPLFLGLGHNAYHCSHDTTADYGRFWRALYTQFRNQELD